MNDYLAMARENIAKNRKKDLSVTVLKDGKPLEGCHISVTQRKHEFLFGANCFVADQLGSPEKNSKYIKRFSDIFNYATLPYYWGSYEPEKGKTNEARLFELNDWCDRLGLEKKGHPLHWHEAPPKWLREEDFDNLEEMIVKRVGDVVRLFKDRVKRWDVVNEITRAKGFNDLISRYEVKRGEANVVDMLSRLVKDIDPQAQLLLNECNLRKDDFSILLTELMERGTPLYGIGLQSHMHEGTYTHEYLWNLCDRYAKFGLPMHFTELSILSGKISGTVDWYSKDGNVWIEYEDSEQVQAQEVHDIYTILFSHPAVEAITWWDIIDKQWLKAPSGLVTQELEPKPAYNVLKDLVKKQWWTTASGKTNAAGTYTANAFYGEYRIDIVSERATLSRNYWHSKHNAGQSAVTISI